MVLKEKKQNNEEIKQTTNEVESNKPEENQEIEEAKKQKFQLNKLQKI